MLYNLIASKLINIRDSFIIAIPFMKNDYVSISYTYYKWSFSKIIILPAPFKVLFNTKYLSEFMLKQLDILSLIRLEVS
jgi:hypothetical protein